MGGKSTEAITRIDASRLTHGPYLAFLKLVVYCDDNNNDDKVLGDNIFPSQVELSGLLGVTPKTLKTWTDVLIDNGWIQVTPEEKWSRRYRRARARSSGRPVVCYRANLMKVARVLEMMSIARAAGIPRDSDEYQKLMDAAVTTFDTDWEDTRYVVLYYKESSYSTGDEAWEAYDRFLDNPNSLVKMTTRKHKGATSSVPDDEVLILDKSQMIPAGYSPLSLSIDDSWSYYVENLSWTPDKKKATVTRSLDPDNHGEIIDTATHVDEDGRRESRGWSETGDQPEREPGETAAEFGYRTGGDSRLRARQRAVMDHLGLDDDVRRMVDECEDKSWETITDLRVIVSGLSQSPFG